MAIVPRDLEEVFRLANGIRLSGLAPYSLVGKKAVDEANASIAMVVMAGAELGLKPMVSLRSFTVINGKPALYGDGLINVIRGSGLAEYLRFGAEERDGKLVGYCEAKRRDTGEERRVEFSQDDAERAGLWQTEARVRRQVWEGGRQVWKDNMPNDAPWFRYPKRMLGWRAAGFCLRELFGDILGGIRDEHEEREIQDAEFVEVEETRPSSTPPPIPEPDQGDEDWIDLDVLEVRFSGAKSEEEVEAIWDEYDLPSALTHDEDELQKAFDMKSARLAEIKGEENGV